MSTMINQKKSRFDIFIAWLERIGNKLPHPFFLFLVLTLIVTILSVIFSSMGMSTTYLKAVVGEDAQEVTVVVKSVLSKDIMQYVFQNLDSIFINFAPLKMIMLLILAIGLCEQVGLFETFIKKTISGAPPYLIIGTVCFIALNANVASNAGVLGTTIVAASVFKSLGYNPWVGIILGYAVGNAGFSANMFVANMDLLMAGITESVTTQLGIEAPVHVLFNWFYMAVATVVLTIVFTIITQRFMIGYIGGSENVSKVHSNSSDIDPINLKALKNSGIASLIYLVVVIAMILPKNSMFRAEDGSILPTSPLMKSILVLLFLYFMTAGITFGRTNKYISDWKTLTKILIKSLQSISGFVVMALPASLFIYLFNASNIPIVLGVNGANFIKSMEFGGFGILFLFALTTAAINLFISSGTTKWLFLAPIMIPMFHAIGFSPALTTLVFRIGDSATNPIVPISTDMALIIGLLEQYNSDPNKKVGMGTVISLCMPYAIGAFIIYSILLAVWYFLNLPIGPGVNMFI